MMQSCASAAKLRSGGPILPIGMKAKGHVGFRHLEPSSAPRHKRTDKTETVEVPSASSILRFTWVAQKAPRSSGCLNKQRLMESEGRCNAAFLFAAPHFVA